ncbi:MAG TPA: alpha/beta hydrolase [Roseiflexaceae bacterium]|nr:alpha/beta hydrolase [Roseiflexaceae bacterium]
MLPSTSGRPVEAFCEQTRLSYLHVGASGPPVLLLHGWSAFKELWWSTMLALAPHAQAYAPDMPGHGDSPLLGSSTMRQIAERIARFCAALGHERVVVVGHSMSGNIALELALARPNLVERLVLVDPAVQPGEMPLYTRSYLDQTFGWAVLRTSMAAARQLSVFGRLVPHEHQGGVVLPALRRVTYMARHDADALRVLLDSLFDNPLGPRLAEVRQPTLVISGEFDPLVPPPLSQRVAAAIPGAQYTVIRRAAHNPMDERPREFSAALLAFLNLAGDDKVTR